VPPVTSTAAPLLDRSGISVLPLVDGLSRHGSQVALQTAEQAVSYTELAARVEDVAARLRTARRLVLITGTNEIDPLVGYLGALLAGCPVLLVPPGERSASWVEAYDPDVTMVDGVLRERRAVSAHDLHPDLALLLTTSGSTGSPRLVRLSLRNVRANAEAVAEALGVLSTDRAATTLPLHYCYGLSVVHSHLLRGATLVLTGLSVADTCFSDLVREQRVTSFAGVPYTFDLLDRVGFAQAAHPSLRYVTQAGGRLAPDRVRHWAEVGRQQGWDLVVMYGQTEATARMACLPPGLAATHPDAVGRAVPGGSLWLEPVEGVATAGVGEVVFAGPNVMLGYADGPQDLGRGRVVDVLRTGDLGTLSDDGLLRVVGRRSRVAKVLGLRVDLEHVEAQLSAHGLVVSVVDDGGAVVAAAEGSGDDQRLRDLVASAAGLPPRAVRAAHVGALPRLGSGKPDLQALPRLVPVAAAATTEPSGELLRDLHALYADVLGRDDLTDDSSFVTAGGDSLSYVELSLRLEELLGHLPAGWHTARLGDLRRQRPGRAARRTLETSVALRALAIVLVVAFHSNALPFVGGAHLLVGVAGYNLARFALGPVSRRQRVRNLLTSAARIAVPTVVWVSGVALLAGGYGLANVLQLNSLLGPQAWGPTWRLWFIEALLQLCVLGAVLLAVPSLDRVARRWPFGVALGVVGLGLLVRFGVVPVSGGPDGIHTAPVVLFLFALGWATARAVDAARRVVVSVAALLTVPGFFGDPQREAVVLGGLLLLLWLPGVRCPGPLRRVAGVLASSSLYIYLTHWQVYPHLEQDHPWLAVAASLVVGVVAWRAVEAVAAVPAQVRRGLGRDCRRDVAVAGGSQSP